MVKPAVAAAALAKKVLRGTDETLGWGLPECFIELS
jgi:hypothetical protein